MQQSIIGVPAKEPCHTSPSRGVVLYESSAPLKVFNLVLEWLAIVFSRDFLETLNSKSFQNKGNLDLFEEKFKNRKIFS